MSELIHPARTMTFDALMSGLQAACDVGFVHRRSGPIESLELYVYTNRCVYDGGWDVFSMIARGLIIDKNARRIVATPFPKFFNVGERQGFIPDLPFEAFDKLDGSLIIIFHHDKAWRCATKGSFSSSQAVWAQSQLDAVDHAHLVPGTTYLAEAVYPENRIVVRYTEEAMVMLAAYDENGRELTYTQLVDVCEDMGWSVATRHAFASIVDLVTHAETLPLTAEGFVVRFSDGLRMKMKGAQYRRVHALISNCTPLAIWGALNAGDDLLAIRRDLPEEFWGDFDQINDIFDTRFVALERRLVELTASVAQLSDKEVGLSLKTYPSDLIPFLFNYRKSGKIAGKVRDSMMKNLRPTANELPGYMPSYTMNRVLTEMDA